jgi:sodium transport system permease protein
MNTPLKTAPNTAPNNALQRIAIIFAKEVRDNLRDRRSVTSGLATGLVGPAVMIFLIIILGRTIFADPLEKTFRLPVAGQENAPQLMAYLRGQGVAVVDAPADPRAAVQNGDLDVVLIIPPDYGADFQAGRPATVEIVMDSTRQSALPAVEQTRSLLGSFSGQIAALRLAARGVSPQVMDPLAIQRVDLATPETQALIFLNMLPYFIILTIFTGGMYVVIDATAGERERGSLEPLLINPAARWEFGLAKLLASIPFAAFAAFFTLLVFGLSFNLIPLEDYVGFQLTLNTRALFAIFLIALPMVLLASALQMIIVTFTRSFKEAQTWVGFLPLIPAMPGLALAFLPVKPSLTTMLIPTFGQQILINQLMRSEPIQAQNVLISTTATLVAALLLIWVALRRYSQERLILGNK